MAGPVPLTATFELGGAIQLDFRTAVRYGRQGEGTELAWSDPTATAVNDFLTTLRINAYVHAFGGIGFDYSVVALKIGLFGNLDVDSQNKFLSRTYLADETKRQINGQALGIQSEVGIKFVATFLFISYEAVIASGTLGATRTFNDWKTIDDYWNSATSWAEPCLAADGGGPERNAGGFWQCNAPKPGLSGAICPYLGPAPAADDAVLSELHQWAGKHPDQCQPHILSTAQR